MSRTFATLTGTIQIFILFAAGLDDIEEVGKTIYDKFEGKLDEDVRANIWEYTKMISKQSKETTTPEEQQKALAVAEIVQTAIEDDVSTDDPGQQLRGILKAVNSVSSLIPGPAGAILGGVASLVLAVIGEGENSMARLLQDLNKKIDLNFEKLENQISKLDSKIDQIPLKNNLLLSKAEFEGAHVTLQTMQLNLKGMLTSSQQPTEADLCYISSQVSSTGGLRVMGMLKVIITKLSNQATSSATQSKVIADESYDLIRMYSAVAGLRKGLLMMARGVYLKSAHTVAAENGLIRIINELDNYDRAWLADLLERPRLNQVKMVQYYPKDDPQLNDYIRGRLKIDIYRTNRQIAELSCFQLRYGRELLRSTCNDDRTPAFLSNICNGRVNSPHPTQFMPIGLGNGLRGNGVRPTVFGTLRMQAKKSTVPDDYSYIQLKPLESCKRYRPDPIPFFHDSLNDCQSGSRTGTGYTYDLMFVNVSGTGVVILDPTTPSKGFWSRGNGKFVFQEDWAADQKPFELVRQKCHN